MNVNFLKTALRISLCTLLTAIIIVTAGSCRGRETASSRESLIIYGSADSVAPDGGNFFMVAVPLDTITVNMKSSPEEKVSALLDSLSAISFNGLAIDLMNIYSDSTGMKIIRIDLREDDSYKGPGTTEPYFSWYDFFQGSAGGQSTTISLINTVLQRSYTGDWPDALEVYYMGEPIGNMDHVNLSGILVR